MVKFSYTPEWYQESTQATWLHKISDADSWLAHIKRIPEHNRQRFLKWFKNVENVSGSMLEMGFNAGKTIYWMSQRFPDLNIIDGFDWNPGVEKLIPHIKHHVSAVRNLEIGHCKDALLKFQDNSYDVVTSLDFFEHLKEDEYFFCIEQAFRVLKDDGIMFMYIGESNNPEHINLRPLNNVIKEIESRGFSMQKRVTMSNAKPNGNQLVIFTKNAKS